MAEQPRAASRSLEAERPETRRGIERGLLSLAVFSFILFLLLALALSGDSLPPLSLLFAGAVTLALTIFALLYIRNVLRLHLQTLERLRGTMVTLAASESAVVPLLPEESDAESARLHAALGDLAARDARDRGMPDTRLTAVLGAVTEAVLVITDQGQISLVNYPAKALLGAERVRVGTSVFAALKRDPLDAAMSRSSRESDVVACELESVDGGRLTAWVSSLAEHGGAVICFQADLAARHRAELEHDLALHDRPPAAPAIADDTPLDGLPVVVLDTETTGLDVTSDRIVAIGAVRLHGTRVYRSRSIDRLVQPGMPIPPRSTAVHGITDAMVADAEGFAAVFAPLRAMLEGCIVVGHNVPFDLAMLRRECALAGIDWQPPRALDTLPIMVAFDPALSAFDLEDLALHFGVEVRGRHTALGDSLVTAEIYARLVPQLMAAGVRSLAEAEAYAQRATAVLEKQKEAGW